MSLTGVKVRLGPNGEKLVKITSIASFIAGFLGLLWTMAIYNTYLDRLPRSPDAVNGNIYALNAHGVVVYQTLAERSHLNHVEYWAWGLGIFGAVLGMICQWREDENIRKGKQPPSSSGR